jgi:hypothetical protein
MDSTIHSVIAAQYVQDRIAEATSARTDRASRRRWGRRKAKTIITADRDRPVAVPSTPVTSS